ncbi:DUF4199 domain-containing protein [Dokdonia ponticola]|uniref:DUF4199 domain-containing protein n=1 Tax=Dokdonia ponticola TaxID=2041041 RepID=A0ABV9I0D1_9FLAO
MEQIKGSAKKIMINYGLLLGVISVLLNVILYATNNHIQPHWSVNLIGFLIFIIVMVTALKSFKKDNGGFMKLGEAIKIGLGVALISTLIGVVYTYVLVNFLEPTYFEQLMSIQRDTMIESNPNMTQEQIDQSMGIAEKFSGAGIIITFQIIGGLFFGFIISLIAGLVLKKDNPAV